ncbi:hypothetical protein Dimus_012066 [Dionaea muscipula]
MTQLKNNNLIYFNAELYELCCDLFGNNFSDTYLRDYSRVFFCHLFYNFYLSHTNSLLYFLIFSLSKAMPLAIAESHSLSLHCSISLDLFPSFVERTSFFTIR